MASVEQIMHPIGHPESETSSSGGEESDLWTAVPHTTTTIKHSTKRNVSKTKASKSEPSNSWTQMKAYFSTRFNSTRRSTSSVACAILVPIFFLLMLFGMDLALSGLLSTDVPANTDPTSMPFTFVPNMPVGVLNSNTQFEADFTTANGVATVISNTYADYDEMDADLLDRFNDPTAPLAAMALSTYTDTAVDAVLVTNDTAITMFGLGHSPSPFLPQALSALLNAFTTRLGLTTRSRSLQAMPYSAYTEEMDIMAEGAIETLGIIFHLTLPPIMASLVEERQEGIRTLMTMAGLKQPVYFATNLIFAFLFQLLPSGIAVILGEFFKIDFFHSVSPTVYIPVLLIWNLCTPLIAVLGAAFFQSKLMATIVGYILVIFLCETGTILTLMKTSELTMMSAMPTVALYQVLKTLAGKGAELEDRRVQWSDLSDTDIPILFPIMVGVSLVMGVAGFLIELHRETIVDYMRHYYRKMTGKALDGPADKHAPTATPAEQEEGRAEQGPSQDVLEEKAAAASGEHPICVSDLHVTYNGLGGEVKAVRGLSLTARQGECLALLGPNGAGKSTTISTLLGAVSADRRPGSPPLRILGKDVHGKGDLSSIYRHVGCCPQDDALWTTLNARETLRFYGALRGLQGEELDTEVQNTLDRLDLAIVDKRIIGRFSGGMKRRLSVACALIGHPKLVCLDEPSTGLDPNSRQALWGMIREASAEHTILLTTHSMEEADSLAQRIGIMVAGQLQCIGTRQHLKSRFGAGYRLKVIHSVGHADEVSALVAQWAPSAFLLKQELVVTAAHTFSTQYTIPSGSSIAGLFGALSNEQTAEEGIVKEFGLHFSNMENVMLRVVTRVEPPEHDVDMFNV
eukprot:gnl/Dysnectes_brevis/819_a904_2258.p1 GENE.gnl/Dysnectes_brevis/819_a904_2258~~gnl/Dysnectes_brevis/819_a904_2258.p1  ORF type:complete len:857 (+),score=343.34 gnl/Dysnectes_brevis/819_a904_2258:45-2615(+)